MCHHALVAGVTSDIHHHLTAVVHEELCKLPFNTTAEPLVQLSTCNMVGRLQECHFTIRNTINLNNRKNHVEISA